MKSALWFLAKFLVFSLLVSVLYWIHSDAINGVWVSLVDWGWNIEGIAYELVQSPRRPTNVQVFVTLGQRRELFSELDGLPFHFNLAPLIGLFLATPAFSLRKKILFTVIGVVLLFPTHVFHIYTNLVQLTTINLTFLNYNFEVWWESVSRWFYFQTLRYSSIFMKQTGTVFLPFLIWSIFYFNMVRFIFYPLDSIRQYIDGAKGQVPAPDAAEQASGTA